MRRVGGSAEELTLFRVSRLRADSDLTKAPFQPMIQPMSIRSGDEAQEPMAQPLRQAAAIPVADGRVCLVTSSSGRRWVVPKGMIDAGHTAG